MYVMQHATEHGRKRTGLLFEWLGN